MAAPSGRGGDSSGLGLRLVVMEWRRTGVVVHEGWQTLNSHSRRGVHEHLREREGESLVGRNVAVFGASTNAVRPPPPGQLKSERGLRIASDLYLGGDSTEWKTFRFALIHDFNSLPRALARTARRTSVPRWGTHVCGIRAFWSGLVRCDPVERRALCSGSAIMRMAQSTEEVRVNTVAWPGAFPEAIVIVPRK